MLSSSYLDTSYLLKAYALEVNSEEVTNYIRTPGPALLVTALTDVELASALMRKLPQPDGYEAYQDYRRDQQQGLFHRLPMGEEVYRSAEHLALGIGSRFRIRSLDVLHLATAISHKAS